MSLGLGRVPEYLGTGFKSKKGFKKLKEFYRNNSSSNNKYPPNKKHKIGNLNYNYKSTKGERIVKFGVLILTFTFLATIIIMLKKPIQSLYNPQTNSQKYIDFIKEYHGGIKQNAYRINIEDGNNYLNQNLLDLAQSSFMRAIEIDNQSKKAYIGLTRTLVKKCVFLNDYCKDANSYLEFIEKKNFLKREEIIKLKSLINENK